MDEEEKYAVPKSVLTAIADRTRAMVGTTEGMTLDEIIYWLGRVIYIPQAQPTSEATWGIPVTNAEAILPDVQLAQPTSEATWGIPVTNAIAEII